MACSKSSKKSGGLGNTNSSPNKKCSPAKHWFFTYHNYPDTAIEKFENCNLIAKYVIGKEKGKSGETPHLQGNIEFKNKLRPKELFSNEIHWEKTRNINKANTYCMKEGDYIYKGIRVPRPIKVIDPEDFYDWENEIMDIINTEPDNRTIHWYWDTEGGVGKSCFCKYLCYKKDALMCGGKASDMKYMIVKYEQKEKVFPDILIFDIPRSNMNWLSYSGIEEIKNGCFASTKYESEMCITPYPHVFCFANSLPEITTETTGVSADKWRIVSLNP